MTVSKRVHQLETSHQPTALTGEMFFSSLIKGTISQDGWLLKVYKINCYFVSAGVSKKFSQLMSS
jgi:hypothetical protein